MVGNLEKVRRLLAAAPEAAALMAVGDSAERSALHYAAAAPAGPAMARLVLEVSPSLVTACDAQNLTPVHYAAINGATEVVQVLLSAAPSAAALAAAPDDFSRCALHYAVESSKPELVRLLLDAAPACVASEDCHSCTPLEALLHQGAIREQFDAKQYEVARLLIAAPGQRPFHLLYALSTTRDFDFLLPLFAEVAARYPLTPAGWCLVPSPCPGLAAALLSVLQRSPAEAALLVTHLPAAERCRLSAAAMCLHRTQAVAGIALPQPLVWRILAACLH